MPEIQDLQVPEESVSEEPVVTSPDYTELLNNIYLENSTFLEKFDSYLAQEKPTFDYTENFNSCQELLSDIKKEVSKTPETGTDKEYESVLKQLDSLNAHLSNMESITIPILVGVGLVVGILCTVIFSNVFHH